MTRTSDLNLRDANLADVEALAQFAIAMAWETEHKRLDPETVRRGIAVVIAEPIRGRYFIAERAGERVGTLMLTYEWSDWRCADWWWIQSVYIVESARRSGVFRALYQHAHALCVATPGVCGLRLYVERDNQRAQATYAALGMQDAAYLVFEQGLPWLAEVVRKSD
ncbi:MAG: GNAT family N-acetyltransferase [Pseudomarimonas sp.]